MEANGLCLAPAGNASGANDRLASRSRVDYVAKVRFEAGTLALELREHAIPEISA